MIIKVRIANTEDGFYVDGDTTMCELQELAKKIRKTHVDLNNLIFSPPDTRYIICNVLHSTRDLDDGEELVTALKTKVYLKNIKEVLEGDSYYDSYIKLHVGGSLDLCESVDSVKGKMRNAVQTEIR
jgi:hypothetical protein